MRNSPNRRDQYDMQRLTKLNAKPWQIEVLKKNPKYTSWGNYEDYMSDKKVGWGSPIEYNSFSDVFKLDDLNELVNFYFELYRVNHKCPHCKGSGLNSATHQISEDWYDFNHTGRKWSDKITDDEVFELLKHGRLGDFTKYNGFYDEDLQKWLAWSEGQKVEIAPPTPEEIPSAEEVNRRERGRGMGHDAINRWICIEQRAKRLGVFGSCEYCNDGCIYDEPEAKVGLQLWYLHPRKGASRGVYIKNIKEKELPDVIKYLKEAAERNANRFSNL